MIYSLPLAGGPSKAGKKFQEPGVCMSSILEFISTKAVSSPPRPLFKSGNKMVDLLWICSMILMDFSEANPSSGCLVGCEHAAAHVTLYWCNTCLWVEVTFMRQSHLQNVAYFSMMPARFIRKVQIKTGFRASLTSREKQPGYFIWQMPWRTFTFSDFDAKIMTSWEHFIWKISVSYVVLCLHTSRHFLLAITAP